MVKIKLNQKWLINEEGDIVEVTNNVGHGLIESGVGKLVTNYTNRMMRVEKPDKRTTSQKKGYKTK